VKRRRRVVLVVLGVFVVVGGLGWVVATPLRRVHALEVELERDLAIERARPAETRAVLRGKPSGGELTSELAAALRGIAPITTYDIGLFMKDGPLCPVRSPLLPLDADLERYRVKLAPSVAAIRAAMQAERVEPEREYSMLELPGDRFSFEQQLLSEGGFELEVLKALENNQTDIAAERVLDLWRLRHDRRRSAAAFGRIDEPQTARLLMEVVVRLGADGLPVVQRELDILEATIPSFSEAKRRERILQGRFSETVYLTPGRFGSRCPQFWVIPYWEEIDRSLRFEETTTRTPPTHLALLRLRSPPSFAREAWDSDTALDKGLRMLTPKGAFDGLGMPGDGGFEAYLADLARLRAARVLCAVRCFSLANGRFPTSLEEALGRRPDLREADPFTGDPLHYKLAGTPTVYSLGPDLVDDGGDPKKDVSLELPSFRVDRR
jgi:alkylhydroperoxidase family enzyme